MDRCQPKNGQYVFQVPAIASDTGFSLLEVQQELQRLQVKGKFLEYVAYLLLLFSTMFPVTHFGLLQAVLWRTYLYAHKPDIRTPN
jgi:hypothetical protein